MKKKGFTLTEMIAVIVIVGIVILIAIPVSRKMVVSNQQDKIENKQKIVEKAMVTYADTDNAKNKCVMMTLSELIDKGYITNKDLGGDYTDLSKNWYYYKDSNEITDTFKPGVRCDVVVADEDTDSSGNANYQDVTVTSEPDMVRYTLKLEHDDTGIPYPELIPFSPKIKIYSNKGEVINTGDSEECTPTECSLEVTRGSQVTTYIDQIRGYKVSDTASSFSFSINEDTNLTKTLVSNLKSVEVNYRYYELTGSSLSNYNYASFTKYAYAGCLTADSNKKSCSSYGRKVVFVAIRLNEYSSVEADDTIKFELTNATSIGSSGSKTYSLGSFKPRSESTKAYYVYDASTPTFYQIRFSGTKGSSGSSSRVPKLKVYATIYYY